MWIYYTYPANCSVLMNINTSLLYFEMYNIIVVRLFNHVIYVDKSCEVAVVSDQNIFVQIFFTDFST